MKMMKMKILLVHLIISIKDHVNLISEVQAIIYNMND